MTSTNNWHEVIEKADAYKSLGQTDIYLSGDNNTDYPWQFVQSCEPGGSHRMEVDTNVWFQAQHPSGLTFRWIWEIEPHSANGKSHYEMDVAGTQRVMALLPVAVRHQFQRFLTTCAEKVYQHALGMWAYAQREFQDSEMLRGMGDARGEVPS